MYLLKNEKQGSVNGNPKIYLDLIGFQDWSSLLILAILFSAAIDATP